MAYELGTWQFDMNRVNAANGGTAKSITNYIMWYYYAFLTGKIGGATGAGLWTLAGSSDGATDSGLDTTDRLSTTGAFDAAKWVRAAAAGTAHSWFALKCPTKDNNLDVYLIFDYVSGADTTLNVVVGRGTLTQGALISGTIRQRPTCTSEITTQSFQFNDGGLGNTKLHGALAPNGSFAVHCSKDGSGRIQHGTLCGFTTENESNNPNKFWLGFAYASSGDLYNIDSPDTNGRSFFTGASLGTALWSRSSTATSSGFHVPIPQITIAGGGRSVASSSHTALDPNAISGATPRWRLDLYDSNGNSTTTLFPKGRIQDFYIAHMARIDGDVTPASGTVEFMAVGQIWVPANAAPSL